MLLRAAGRSVLRLPQTRPQPACAVSGRKALPPAAAICSRSLVSAKAVRTENSPVGDPHAMPEGLKAFFPPDFTATDADRGRSWRTRELRQKSFTDLHKLWYILLKERNMLNTIRLAARSQGVPMPSPERLHKVKESMRGIKIVIGERDQARAQFAAENPEEYVALREAAGVVETPRPKPQLRSDTQREQLLGVTPPNLPKPGQMPRPMTKQQRYEFRRALAKKRNAVVREEKASLKVEMAAVSDADLNAAVEDVMDHLRAGWDMDQLPLRKRMAVREARLRGLEAPPRFDRPF